MSEVIHNKRVRRDMKYIQELFRSCDGVDTQHHQMEDCVEMNRQRDHVLKEILNYERSYNHSLNVLKDQFALVIKRERLVSEDVYRAIFPSELDIIIAINLNYLMYLEKIIDCRKELTVPVTRSYIRTSVGEATDSSIMQMISGSDEIAFSESEDKFQQLSRVLLHFGYCFKLYVHYISKYEKVINALDEETRRNRRFAAYLEVMKQQVLKEQGEHKLTLHDYLIQPVQTLPRYQIFLEKILKNTLQSDHSYQDIQKSLTLIVSIAEYCNKKQSDQYFDNLLLNFSKRSGLIELLQPGRKLLLYANEEIMYCKRDQNVEEAAIYLLSDCLVISPAARKPRVQYLRGVVNGDRIHVTKCSRIDVHCLEIWVTIETRYESGITNTTRLLCSSPSLADQIESTISKINKETTVEPCCKPTTMTKRRSFRHLLSVFLSTN